MIRRMRQRILLLLALLAAFVTHVLLYSNYLVVRPGPVVPASQLVRIDTTVPGESNFMVTAVHAKRANLLDGVFSLFDPSTEIQKLGDYVPEGVPWKQYADFLQRTMGESQRIGATVALRHLGRRIEARLVSEKIGPLVSETYEVVLPQEIRFTSGDISGASAGLMIALEVYDQLTTRRLASDSIVVGTGDLRLDGSVRPVGGVKQKVLAAENYGADVFFVPRENVQEAIAVARRVHIVGVDTFEEAVRWLELFGERE